MIYLLLSILTFFFAQESAQNIIKEVQKKYNSMTDLSADLVQGTNQSKFVFKKTNKFRLEFKNTTIISDGKAVYNYNKKKNQVTIANYEGNYLSPEYLLFNIPAKAEMKLESENISNGKVWKISFDKLGSESNYSNLTIWVNKDYLISKVKVEDKSKNIYQFSLKNIQINKNVSDAPFNFKTPDGAKVIDLR